MDATTWGFRVSACIGKQAFSTPQLANKVQRRRAKKRRTYKVKQHAYHCKACGLFHLGSSAEPRHTTASGRKRFRAYDIGGDDSMN